MKFGELTKGMRDESFIDEEYEEMVDNIIEAGKEIFVRTTVEIN